MEAVFLKLVNMSFTASYLAIAVLLLRIILKKSPKFIRVILWGLVGLRLACPISFESVLSLVPSVEPFPEEFLYAARPQISTGISSLNQSINPIIAQSLEPNELVSANPTQIYSFILSQIWILGMLLMALYALISYLMIHRRVRISIPVGNQIRLCDRIDTPFILGIMKPRIYLPSGLSQETADHVLAHEYAHLKRKDHWWKPLGFLLLTVHWFNPVMWLSYQCLCRDIEFACDEKVASDMDSEARKSYSTALLQCSVPRRMICACPLAFGEVGIKERIKSVLHYKKPGFWVVVITLLVCVAVAVCFLTDPVGIPLRKLSDPDFSRVNSITVRSEDHEYEITTREGIQTVSELLDEIKISSAEISKDRSEDRDQTNALILHFETLDHKICFNKSLSEVWADDSIKPTFSHTVMNPDLLNSFFQSGIEEPAANRLDVGIYKPVQCIYLNPLSSFAPVNLVREYTYEVTETGFTTEADGFICNTVAENVDWNWKPVSECYEELKFFYKWQQTDYVPRFTLQGSDLYQKLDTKNHLLMVDDELWMVHSGSGRTELELVWGIYRLLPEESAYRYDAVTTAIGYPVKTTLEIQNPLNNEILSAVYDHLSFKDAPEGAFFFESHIILSEVVGCAAADQENGPVGFRDVEIIALVICCTETDGTVEVISEKLIPAIIKFEEWPNSTYARESYLQCLEDQDAETFIQKNFSPASLDALTSLTECEQILRKDIVEQVEDYFS